METKYENLNNEMKAIDVSPSVVRAMNELCYTAAETGVVPSDFYDNADLIAMVQIVHLAEKYKIDGVPSTLRM